MRKKEAVEWVRRGMSCEGCRVLRASCLQRCSWVIVEEVLLSLLSGIANYRKDGSNIRK
jgi:hypothetical protein